MLPPHYPKLSYAPLIQHTQSSHMLTPHYPNLSHAPPTLPKVLICSTHTTYPKLSYAPPTLPKAIICSSNTTESYHMLAPPTLPKAIIMLPPHYRKFSYAPLTQHTQSYHMLLQDYRKLSYAPPTLPKAIIMLPPHYRKFAYAKALLCSSNTTESFHMLHSHYIPKAITCSPTLTYRTHIISPSTVLTLPHITCCYREAYMYAAKFSSIRFNSLHLCQS